MTDCASDRTGRCYSLLYNRGDGSDVFQIVVSLALTGVQSLYLQDTSMFVHIAVKNTRFIYICSIHYHFIDIQLSFHYHVIIISLSFHHHSIYVYKACSTLISGFKATTDWQETNFRQSYETPAVQETIARPTNHVSHKGYNSSRSIDVEQTRHRTDPVRCLNHDSERPKQAVLHR